MSNTKRNGNSTENNKKKPKLDDEIDALWDDDIDESTWDDCIKIATQVLDGDQPENSTFNITKLPTYNAFQQKGPFCSTQLYPISQASTSDAPNSNKENLEHDTATNVKALQQKCQEKEGEVAVLRTQLKETKANFMLEQQKSLIEWKRKLVLAEKQTQSVKSELEFKNLEIGNLKQKLLNVTKHTQSLCLDNGIDKKNITKKIIEPALPSTGQTSQQNKIYSISENVYQLKNVNIQERLLLPMKETYVIESKRVQLYRNTIPYLQNQDRFTKIIVNKCNVDFGYILRMLVTLLNCTKSEMNSEQNTSTINEVLSITHTLLANLLEMLKDIKSNIQTEDILKADIKYKKCFERDFEELQEDKIGIKAGVLLDFISDLLPFNSHVQEYFYKDEIVIFQKGGWLTENVSGASKTISGFNSLQQVVEIVKICGEIRLADVMSQFLNSSIKLFTTISKLGYYNEISDIFCQFTQELIFSRPLPTVIFQITSLLNEASVHSSFLQFIFNKSKTCSSNKDGNVYFNTDACRFYIFVYQFDLCLYRVYNPPINVCMNMFCFIYKTYITSYWLHHQNAKECNCLAKLYKLEVELLHRVLQNLTKNAEAYCADQRKSVITILSLMIFHSYELTGKYITVFSQYKNIEKQLEDDDEFKDPEQINVIEEVPSVPSKDFDKVQF